MQEKAEMLARFIHAGQKYDGADYVDAHVAPGVRLLQRWGYGDDDELIASMWLHDGVEDIGDRLPDRSILQQWASDQIAVYFGEGVRGIVWAVTGIGHNRKARNANYYEKIAAHGERAATVKLADRFINYSNSAPESKHREMYDREMAAFAAVVEPLVPAHLWEEFKGLWS